MTRFAKNNAVLVDPVVLAVPCDPRILYTPLGPFRVTTSPKSDSYRPRQA